MVSFSDRSPYATVQVCDVMNKKRVLLSHNFKSHGIFGVIIIRDYCKIKEQVCCQPTG